MARLGGVAGFLLFAYSLATLVQVVVLGGPPSTAAEAFRILQENRAVGLMRLDLPTICALPLYYLVFLGLFAALRESRLPQMIAATAVAFAGLTLVLATPTALPMLALSEKHAAATSPEVRGQLLAAGEAILASDIWHGTGAFIGGLMAQSALLWTSLLMLRTNVFSRATGHVGVVTHGLDLLHIAIGPFLPRVALVLMAVAGPLYLVWFPLVARRLLQLGADEEEPRR